MDCVRAGVGEEIAHDKRDVGTVADLVPVEDVDGCFLERLKLCVDLEAKNRST